MREAQTVERSGSRYYFDGTGYIPVTSSVETVDDYTYGGSAYTGAVYYLVAESDPVNFNSYTHTGGSYQVSTSGTTYNYTTNSNYSSITYNPFNGIINKVQTSANGNYTYLFYSITDRYGADISDRWPDINWMEAHSASPVDSYKFISWISATGSYYRSTHSNDTNIKSVYSKMSAEIINLSGGAGTATTDNTGSGDYPTHIFQGRFNASPNLYLYEIYYWDPALQDYPSTASLSYLVNSNGNIQNQTKLQFNGYEFQTQTPTTGNGSTSVRQTIKYYYKPVSGTVELIDAQNPDANTNTLKTETFYYGQSIANVTDGVTLPEYNGYVFNGWFDNADGIGNAFDFNTTFDVTDQGGTIQVYACYSLIRFTISIDPDGGEIDHINHNYTTAYNNYYWSGDRWGSDPSATAGTTVTAWPFAVFNRGQILASDGVTVERAADAGYNRSASTVVNLAFNKTLSEYVVERNYIPMSDAAADEYAANGGTIYYYVNTQYDETVDGIGNGYGYQIGPPSDLRNALYMTEAELHQYYLFYRDWTQGNIDGGYITGVTLLGEAAWRNQYHVTEQKYRKAYEGEHYEFLNWYEVLYDSEGNEIGLSNMPYNFDTPVTGPLTIRATWRLDAGYTILYSPEYTMEDGTVINGTMWMNTWTDPSTGGAKYVSGAKTEILQQPTGLTANGVATEEYIFRGWRLVSPDGVPLENGIYYDPGAPFTIDAADADNSGIIRMQAVYEEKDSSYRRPYITNLKLDANSGYLTTGSYYNGDDLVTGTALTANQDLTWDGIGTAVLDADADTITFSKIQTGTPLHLYRYATKLTEDSAGAALDPVGRNYFTHPSGFLLLGFDKAPNEGDFIATYPADSVIAVQRNEDDTIYAVWEPMVYLNLVNNTIEDHGDLTVKISSTDGSALTIVNEKKGTYERVKVEDLDNILVKQGETLRLAIPNGAGKSITISGTNNLGTGYMLYWETDLNGVKSGHPSGNKENLGSYSFSDTLYENTDDTQKGLTVTFTTKKASKVLILDENWSGGSVSEVYFSDVSTDSNYIGNPYLLPVTSTRPTYAFLGWDADGTKTSGPAYSAESESTRTINDPSLLFPTDVDEVTLYAIWDPQLEAGTVKVFKAVPEPGNTAKEFTFTVAFSGSWRNVLGAVITTAIPEQSGTFTLKDGQYLAVKTETYDGSASTKASWTVTVQKYAPRLDGSGNPVLDTQGNQIYDPSGSPTTLSWTNTSNSQIVFYQTNLSVTEDDYSAAYYTTTSAVEAQLDSSGLVASGRSLSWTNTSGGGTVIFTNERQTGTITVKKVLLNENVTRAFTFTGSWTLTEDSVTTTGTLTNISVSSASSTGTAFAEKVPIGAVLTVTEVVNNDYEIAVSAANGSTDTDAAEKSFTFTVPGDETLTYTNTLKSYPVKIVKVGFDGTTETNIEARFSLAKGTSVLVNKLYTTPSNNVIYDNTLSVGSYLLTEHWVEDGYLGLPNDSDGDGDPDVTLTVSGNDTVTSNDDTGHIVITGDKTNGFVVKVYNQKTVDLTIRKVLIDPLLGQGRTFYFGYSYTNTLNGKTETVSRSGGTALAVASGSSTTITVPIGATGLTVSEETSRKVSSGSSVSIGDTYDTYVAVTNGATTIAPSTESDSYTYASVAGTNNGDVITFTNNAKTIDVTVKKVVETDNKNGVFSFTVTLLNGAQPIVNYSICDVNHTPADPTDDDKTDAADGTYALNLANGDEIVLTIPVGARMTVQETAVTGNGSGDNLDEYFTSVATTLVNGGTSYTGTTWVENTRLYTLTAAPSDDLLVVFTNGPGGRDVRFKKTDGFGDALAGANFSLYRTYANAAAHVLADRVSLMVNDTSVLEVTSEGSYDSVTGANVAFKVQNGVYYMAEVNTVSGYETNDKIYRVVVGAAGTTVEGITLPAGTEYLIERMSGASTVEAVPDVMTYGIMNISKLTRKVILKKIDGSDYKPLPGATFDVFAYDRTTVRTGLSSGDAGAFLAGTLPYGTYYLRETTVPAGYGQTFAEGNWFTLTVNAGANGTNLTGPLQTRP